MSDLGALSAAWQRFGCALCGQIPIPNAEGGWRIELHHVKPRSQGGGDEAENLVGLCGELLPNKCHWRVTTNRVRIAWEPLVDGWVWTDTETDEEGLLRVLTVEMTQNLRIGKELVKAVDVQRDDDAPIPTERLPEGLRTEPGRLGAEDRFRAAQELVRRAERTWMALALILQASVSMGDPEVLDFQGEEEWANAIGIGKGTLSKLRTVAQIFEGEWLNLPKADMESLTFEGLYVAARMVRRGDWSVPEALSEAVAKPDEELWTVYKFGLPAREVCECPVCGKKHYTVSVKDATRLRRQELAAGLTTGEAGE